jgi:uroporphyrinogen-III synthase
MRAHALRVAVTRDEGLDGPLTEALRRRGLDPVTCTVVSEAPPPEPEPLARAAQDLETYQWLVVASQRAVSALLEARGGKRLPASLRTAAVGAKSAARLAACGADSPLIAPGAGAAALIAALRGADLWPGRRVLIPRALEGGRELGQSLRHWGACVDEVVAYRTLERSPAEIVVTWDLARPDAVVVASPSAARALVRAVGADALRRLERVAAIGSTTAMQLMALGVPAVVSAGSDFEAVADLLTGPPAELPPEASR